MKKIAIAIRGHERETMSDKEMSDVIYEISNIYDVDIFIHTWNLSEASYSWRNVPSTRNQITEEKILNYFLKNKNQIKKIFIENDEEIELHGRIEGRIGILTELSLKKNELECVLKSNLKDKSFFWAKNLVLVPNYQKNIFCFLQFGCPVLPWKRMWHGIYTLVKFINEFQDYDLILNTRFDILKYKKNFNPGSPFVDLKVILDLISSIKEEDNFKFLKKRISACCDNIYIAKPKPLLSLCENFHFRLDEVLDSYKIEEWSGIQEHLVFLEAERLSKKTF